MAGHTHDLIAVVPDGAIEQVVTNLLEQRVSQLGISKIKFEVKKDIFHDNSSEAATVDLLRGYIRTHRYALVIRDLEGSGWENDGAAELEAAFRDRIRANGWPDRVEVIALEPEIEAWLRFDSAAFQSLIEQQARSKKPANGAAVSRIVASATQANGGATGNKPKRPKEVFESVLAEFGIPRSNSLYGRLAKQEVLSGCRVGSFNRFSQILTGWFPSTPTR
jgi:hypothetical protein